MKLYIALLAIVASTAFAGEPVRKHVSRWDCKMNSPQKDQDARMYFDLVTFDGVMHIENFLGHVWDNGYYGVFNLEKLAHKPFVRKPSKYTNHYRFESVDSVATGGSESGMWGSFYAPYEMETLKRGEFEVHYLYQAGDHRGNTVHLSCVND